MSQKLCERHGPMQEVQFENVRVDICPAGDQIVFDGPGELAALLAFKLGQYGVSVDPNTILPPLAQGQHLRHPQQYFQQHHQPGAYGGHGGFYRESSGHGHGYGRRRHGSGSGDGFFGGSGGVFGGSD